MSFQNFTRIATGQLSIKGCLSVAGLKSCLSVSGLKGCLSIGFVTLCQLNHAHNITVVLCMGNET
jgi:hypothetical protein